MNAGETCEYLGWDSDFFGKRIARATVSSLSEKSVSDIVLTCERQKIDCLYLLASSSDSSTIRVAENHGFHLVDIRLTLNRSAHDNQPLRDQCSVVRDFIEEDIPGLRAIASESHRDSRFYEDGHFPVETCCRLFETWIERSCRGWAQNVLVAGEKGVPEGYITCHLRDAQLGQIGLIAVGPEARGKGLGEKLVHAAISWFERQGIEAVDVVTQGRNVRAQRLYQRCGFVSKSVELWYHRWFSLEQP